MSSHPAANTKEGTMSMMSNFKKKLYDILTPEGEKYQAQVNEDKDLLLPYVLADVNDIRLALAIGEGKLDKLPPGVRSDPKQCVMARALSNGWKTYMERTSCQLFHPADDLSVMSEARIALSVDQLMQMGFENVRYGMVEAFDHAEALSLPDPEWDNEAGEYVDEDRTPWYRIQLDNTIPMEYLIDLFDNGEFPDLILEDENSYA